MAQTVRQGSPRSPRRSSLPWLLWLAAVLAGTGYWLLFHTTYFLITSVNVKGASRVSVDEVLARADIVTGVPLAGLKSGPAVDAIGELPQVAAVSVERVWPHTVLITVTERTPVAVAHFDGTYVEVDDQGVPASPPTSAAPAGIVAIDGKPGTPAMRAAVAVVRALPKKWRLKAVSAPTQDSVSVSLGGSVRIMFGSGEDVERKVAVATALLANKYRTIDVSAPDAPTVR